MMDLAVEIEKDFEKIKMRLYTNGIMNVVFKPNFLILMQDIEELMKWMEIFPPERKFVNLMESEGFTNIDTEVRAFSASKNENKYTIADAMVIQSNAHKILTNFYLNFNKPYKPTKIFTDRQKAIDWLLSQKEEYYKNQE